MRLFTTTGLISVGLAVLLLTFTPPSQSSPNIPLANTPAPVNSNWLGQVQKDLEQREYHFSRNAAGELQAPNRRHGLRLVVDDNGVSVNNRTDNSRLLQFSTLGIGRSVLHPLPQAQISTDGNRLSISHGGIEEWFINSAKGVEHGYTLNKRPEGTGNLRIVLDLGVELWQHDGNDLKLTTQNGQTMRYAKLRVQDTKGKTIPAYFDDDATQLALVIDDTHAIYPLTVDPLLTGNHYDAKLIPNQVEAGMGVCVAGAGDINGDGFADIIIGADKYDHGEAGEGVAFIYHGTASGINTTYVAMLESNQTDAKMGTGVAGAGDINGDGYTDIIVGVPGYDDGENNEGAAFIYYGYASGINTTAAAILVSNQEGAFMGVSVAGTGDINGDGFADIIIGASYYNNIEIDEGAAFIYHGSASGINTTASAMLESNQTNSGFGNSVAGAGDINGDGFADIIVGAHSYTNGENDEGAAFVYHGSAAGINTTASVMLESNQEDAAMGTSVAGAGDINGDGFADIIVGASWYSQGEFLEGGAFIYHGGATGINTTATTILESNKAGARMGNSVSGAGDVNGDGFSDIIVGAYFYDIGYQPFGGAAYIYHGSDSGINTIAAATMIANSEDDRLGSSVAGAGDINGDGFADIIVGAPGYTFGNSGEGAAFVYHGGSAGINTTSMATLQSDQISAFLGSSVAGAGDVNGDGYADIIVGASNYDNGETNEGAAFIYHGSTSGISSTAAVMLESDQTGAYLGTSVAGAGDVNNDGYADIVVGAKRYSNGESEEGAAFVYHGSASGITTTTQAILESNQESAYMGTCVAGAGDVNGDGYADIIVGASNYDNGQTNEGAAFVYHGSASGISTTAAATLEANQTNIQLGTSVAGAGDVNGDGYTDVIVGAPYYDNVQSDEGAAFIYHGSSSGINTTAATIVESDQVDALLGQSVAGAGDINGDGYADVVAGAKNYDDGHNNEGAAYIYHGSAAGIGATEVAILESDQENAYMGISVAGAGDVNGDSYDDIIVGAYNYTNGETQEGAAYIYHGSAAGISSEATTTLESNLTGAYLGYSVAGAGDINGDGYADVVIGAYGYTNGESQEGAALVYHGNSNGRDLRLWPRRDSSATGLHPWSMTGDSKDTFQLRLKAISSQGKAKVRSRVDICPQTNAPTSFGSPLCTTAVSVWQNSETTMEQVVTVINPQLYRWRTRLEYLPWTGTTTGIVKPAHPAHGPWRFYDAHPSQSYLHIAAPPLQLSEVILVLQTLCGGDGHGLASFWYDIDEDGVLGLPEIIYAMQEASL